MPDNHLRRAFLVLVVATLLLVAVGVVQERVPFLREHLRPISLTADLRPTDALEPQPVAVVEDAPVDSAAVYRALLDSLANAPDPPYDGAHHLLPFCRALDDAALGSARIAWFGDSITEGDLVTRALRDSLQARYGGRGVGWVAIGTETNFFRRTIGHSYDGRWRRHSVLEPDSVIYDVGLLGDYHLADQAWVEYRSSRYSERTRPLPRARLFYGDAPPGRDSAGRVYVLADERERRVRLPAPGRVNAVTLDRGPTDRLYLSITTNSGTPVFGVSFDGPTGVYLDNLALRGATGLQLRHTPFAILQGFEQHMGYDLIVLHVGLNVLGQTFRPGFDWYAKDLADVIRRLQRAFPDAAFMIVGVGDRAIRQRGELVTDPDVVPVRDALRATADSTGAAFFDLFEAMGGPGTMQRWVATDPPLAQSDYTHVSPDGGDRVAGLIEGFLHSACTELGYAPPAP